MQIRTLAPYIATFLLIAGLSLQAQSALASGTSSADLQALAEKGSKMAQRALGQRYAVGARGLPQDMNQAIYWLQKAAERGDGPAQYTLGLIYGQGTGIQQDWVQAHMWFSLAGAPEKEIPQANREIAEQGRKVAEANMTAAQIEEARALASAWLAQHSLLAQASASDN